MKESEKRLFLWPVRRVLMAVTLAYLSGILMITKIPFSVPFAFVMSTLVFVLGALRLMRRKSVLFFVLVWMVLLGNLRAGYEMGRRDLPTEPGVMIEGVIEKIEKPYRVYLRDVRIDAAPSGYARSVVVTLMCEEGDEQPLQPKVGQRVAGKGRLFAPDEKRNPGGVDWRIQAICEGYELSGYLLPGWTAEGDAMFSFWECLRLLRSSINAQVERLFGDQAPLFQGIMLGDRSALDDEITAAMRLTGTAHILTVSGLHLSLIAGAISALLGRFSLRRRNRFAILSIFLLLFTALTGAAAGTIRACIMAMLREGAKLRGRRYEPLTALSFAALCMTIVQPLWLLSASFQFSFFAVLSIQLFAGSFSKFAVKTLKLSGRWLRPMNLLSVSLSAQLGSVPMQLMLYGYVPLLSLPMNAVCAWIMPALLLGGWLAAAASLVSWRAGTFMAYALSWTACAFETLSLEVASLRGAIVRLPAPYTVTVLLVLLLLLLLSPRIRLGRLRRMAVAAAILMAAGSYAVRFDPGTRYVQLDVGQGDGALLRRGRHAVLVDVGPVDSYDMLRYLRHEGLFVDAVILSHLDEDHAGALGVLLASEIDVPAVITAKGAADQEMTQSVHDVLQCLGNRHIALHEVRRGDRVDVSGFALDVLSPDDALLGSNERSLLLYTQAEGVSLLLAGDLPIDSEPEYVPKADVLKVAHHGSKNSTSDAFAQMAAPSIAIISAGRNNWYGHPHERVLKTLAKAQVLRTDQNGCITLRLKDGACSAQCFFEP